MKWSFTLLDVFLISPFIALFLFSLVPLTAKVFNDNKEPSPFFSVAIPFIGILTAGALGLSVLVHNILQGPHHRSLVFSEALWVDASSLLSLFLVLFITGSTLLLSRESCGITKKQFSEWVFLLLNSAWGLLLVSWANDLLLMFIGIEVFSLCFYVLVMLSREEILSKEAALKYFIIGSVASAFMAYGLSFIYGLSGGITYLSELVAFMPQLSSVSRLFLVGLGLVSLGLFFKVSLFPFQWWTPDVYQGSATPLTGFMATAVKVVVFTFFLRFVITGFLTSPRSESFVDILEWVAALTMLLGNGAALMQASLKRMLAYSAIAHSGYILMGVLVAGYSETLLGASAVHFYLLSYVPMTLGVFAFLGLFEKDENMQVSIDDLKGLGSRYPYISIGMTLFMISLAGLPLTAGFFGKFFLFSSTLKGGFYWLSFWAILNSVISLVYYLRPVLFIYMKEEVGLTPSFSRNTLTIFALCVFLTLIIGIFPQVFYNLTLHSAIGLGGN